MAEAIAPCLSFPRRILKHPRLMPYNRLVVLTMAVNLGWAIYAATAANWWTSDGADLGALALTAQMNLAAAVIFRQPYILNALAWLVTRPPTSWPLRVRWTLGKYYHFGGLHVGAALAGTLWYLALVMSMIRDAVVGVGEAPHAHMILAATIATTFTVMVVMALPRLRAAAARPLRGDPSVLWLGGARAGVDQHHAVRRRSPRRPVARLGAAGRAGVLAGRAERRIGLLAVVASPPRAGQMRAPVVARRDSASRSRRGTRRRHHPADQPTAVRRLAPLRQRAGRAGDNRVPHAGVARRRLDRRPRRRTAETCVGARYSGGGRGQRAQVVHQGGAGGDRQRHRAGAGPLTRHLRPDSAGLGDEEPAPHLR